jgi:hypothetical protein
VDTGKVVQLKIDILCAIHFTVSAWQHVTQCTIQNYFVKCGHVKKNQEGSDVMEVNGSGEDNVTQEEDWVQLGASTTGMHFDTCLWTWSSRHVVCWEVDVVWRRGKVMVVVMTKLSPKPVLSFTEVFRAFESMRAFMYAHYITERDQMNIINIERFEKERCY